VTDTTIRINGHTYNVVVYIADDTGYWRAEAGYMGRVIEVIDVPHEAQAWAGIRKVLVRRNGNGAR